MIKIIIYIYIALNQINGVSGFLGYSDISKLQNNKYISQTISIIYKNINKYDKKCNIAISGENIYIGGLCDDKSLDNAMRLEIQKNIYSIVDQIWPSIIGRSSGYNQETTEFVYTGSLPIFVTGDKIELSIYNGEMPKFIYILSRYFDIKVFIPISDIRSQVSKKYISWFVANRDIKLYSACQKQNFDIAMQKLKSIKLGSGEKLNINKELTNLSGYCMGGAGSSGKYMFYQGVCGTSTLFFRNALINPYIYINKRQGHSNWFTKYYGDYIYGDDAAIYEMDKQFEIKNNTDKNMYIKFWTSGNLYNDSNKYLVSIFPGSSDKIIKIKKQQMNKNEISANISKYVYINSGQSLHIINSKSQSRLSTYYNKIYDTN